VLQSIFKNINWPNHATSDHWDTKKIKIIRYFMFCLNFDVAKWGLQPSYPLPWLRPWFSCYSTLRRWMHWMYAKCRTRSSLSLQPVLRTSDLIIPKFAFINEVFEYRFLSTRTQVYLKKAVFVRLYADFSKLLVLEGWVLDSITGFNTNLSSLWLLSDVKCKK